MHTSTITFTKIDNTEPVTAYLAETLQSHLTKGEKVVWLIPGGSSIAIAAAVSQRLGDANQELLTVTLTDERFGPVEHADSNWLQLEQAGFSLPQATLHPVLTGEDLQTTVTNFGEWVQKALSAAEYAVGFFGIGADGHTAGMLPGSPAASSSKFTEGYDAGLYTRITITAPAIAQLDEAVVYAMGEAKQEALENLKRDIPLAEQPAQALKQVPKLTIFNDQVGE